jgi:uncharacterized protein YndB with AHSA1/START domain
MSLRSSHQSVKREGKSFSGVISSRASVKGVKPAGRKNKASAEMANRELIITHVFDAPCKIIWKAWTEAKHVEKWWGPYGFTNPLCEWDARPGGEILVHMQGPKGSIYNKVMPMKGEFQAVDALERLVFNTIAIEDANGRPQLETLNTITLKEYRGKTKLTLEVTVLKATPEAAEALVGMRQGWAQSLEKLSAHIEKMV